MASGRCAPTPSGRSCSTSTTPRRSSATLAAPLLTPTADEQDGYVPNVVYSCGAMRHGDIVVVPYGIADTSIGFATVDLPALLDEMVP